MKVSRRPSTIMSQKLSVEGLGSPPETSNLRFSIYDLRSVKKDIANVFDAAEHGDSRAIMKFSKAKNFNVDAKDRYGRTALIWACDCGHLQCVESLLRLSASIHLPDSHTGRTGIHWAARSGSLPIVKLLTQYGIDFKKADNYGLTPLYLAKSKGFEGEAVFKYLLSEGAPYNEIKSIDVHKIEQEIVEKMAQLTDESSQSEPGPVQDMKVSVKRI